MQARSQQNPWGVFGWSGHLMQNIIFRPDTRAWLQWLFAFNASLSLAGNSGRLTRERQTVARAALPTVTSECGVFSCVSINNNVANFFFFFFLTRAQMLMHAIAHWGCADTVRESALTADSGRKSLFSPRTRTRVSIAPGFSRVGPSTTATAVPRDYGGAGSGAVGTACWRVPWCRVR